MLRKRLLIFIAVVAIMKCISFTVSRCSLLYIATFRLHAYFQSKASKLIQCLLLLFFFFFRRGNRLIARYQLYHWRLMKQLIAGTMEQWEEWNPPITANVCDTNYAVQSVDLIAWRRVAGEAVVTSRSPSQVTLSWDKRYYSLTRNMGAQPQGRFVDKSVAQASSHAMPTISPLSKGLLKTTLFLEKNV